MQKMLLNQVQCIATSLILTSAAISTDIITIIYEFSRMTEWIEKDVLCQDVIAKNTFVV